jgi:hypothetical protein
MGECGCGNFDATFRLPGPDKLTYVIQIYPSCNDCSTPVGLIVHRMTSEDLQLWDAEHLPELFFDKQWDDSAAIPIIHPEKLLGVLQELAGGDAAGEYEIDGFLQDHVPEAVREAVFRSR